MTYSFGTLNTCEGKKSPHTNECKNQKNIFYRQKNHMCYLVHWNAMAYQSSTKIQVRVPQTTNPPTIPFGNGIRIFWKKDLSAIKSAVLDSRQTMQCLKFSKKHFSLTQLLQPVPQLDPQNFIGQLFTRYYTQQFDFCNTKIRCCVHLKKTRSPMIHPVSMIHNI